MAKSYRIERRVTKEQKEAWQAFCQAQGVSESDMLGLMFEKVTAGNVAIDHRGLKETKTDQIKIRLNTRDMKRITERAKAEGFTSRTAWLTAERDPSTANVKQGVGGNRPEPEPDRQGTEHRV